MATVTWKWTRKAARWALTGCLMLGGAAPVWAAAPAVSVMLKYHPAQDGVPYATPKPEEEAGCKVELVKGPTKGSGWTLKDANGKTLRVFFDSNDDNKIDQWSYYKDGVEVYREYESDLANATGRPDQFRWLNSGGMKWGVDEAKDGHIKRWKAISSEEVSQEVLQTLATKDFARLQALMLTEADMKQLGMSEEQAAHIRELEKAAPAKFQKTIADLPKISAAKPTWVHLETGAPECIPADQAGARMDVVKYTHGSILFEVGGATDWLQTGEMIQVGAAWRIIDAPTAGAASTETAHGESPGLEDPKLMALVNELTDLDKKTPEAGSVAGPNPLTAKHHLLRTDLLEKIVAIAKPEQRDPWVRQMADSLSTAAQNSPAGDTTAMSRLVKLEESLVKSTPGGNLAAYVTYREMQADYAVRITKEKDYAAVQQAWVERLTKFVDAYPKADDTPDALLQLGMVNEFLNKEVEAKNWYGVLLKNFPDSPQAKKAGGAIARLGLEGQPLKLAGQTLADPNTTYNVEQARGKVVAVYYWASWNSQSASDFTKLKAVADAEGGKGVELVCVNLDNTPKEATDFLAHAPAVGVHLYQSGGLESKLATDYGIMVLPNLFLVGKDGKVVSRSVQINNLEDEVKKLLK
jgi:Thioredoxin-like